MTPTDPNEKARELLAAEFDKDEVTAAAARRVRNENATPVEDAAIRAIARALSHAAAVEDDSDDSWCQCETCRRRKDPQPAPAAVAGGDAEEDAYVIDALAHLLAEISVIVNGPEPAGTKWSYHDLPKKVRALAAQPAAGGGLAELVEAMELPEGYTVVEELPGVWTYSHMQGEQRMVCSASWNHPALAACAAWNDTAAQRPGSGDDTARLDWIDSQVQCYGDGYTEPREAGWCVQWQQSKPGEYWTNLRDWIDEEMARTEDVFGEFSQPASGEAS